MNSPELSGIRAVRKVQGRVTQMLTSSMAKWLRSSGCMLTFHRAAPAGEWEKLPNRNFYLNLDFLDRLIAKLILNKWKIVTVDELLCALDQGNDGARLINFSVDDGYRDTWEHIVPLFRRHGVPVTLFVTTGIPDGTLPLGWAGLESILAQRDSVVLNGETIDVSSPAHKRHWFTKISTDWDAGDFSRQFAAFCQTNGADAVRLREEQALTWEMLETFSGDPLVEIGAHTVSHPRVSCLTANAALHELAGSAERLRSRLGVPCRHFAFPYGRSADCGARDFDLAREAGFASAATTCKGVIRSGQDAFCLPRNTINGAYQSMAYVNAFLSGLAGIGARVLGRV
jgi:peptidoglycan/xylan/chitin deacetylase (PgdA/CDA1 family)